MSNWDAVQISWEVSRERGSQNVSWEDLGVENVIEWAELSESEQQYRVERALDDCPNEVARLVSTFTVLP